MENTERPTTVEPTPEEEGVRVEPMHITPVESGWFNEQTAESSNVEAERYLDRCLIARGGQGEIRQVYDRRLRRGLAMKIVLPTGDKRRFLHEIYVTAALEHASIVHIHDGGFLRDGRPYFCMPLLDPTRSLHGLITKARSLEQRMKLLPHLVQVTKAVSYAHANGFMHRDLKPSNILVGRYGETIVIDWGLAKRMLGKRDGDGQRGHARAIGRPVGTPAYTAPEQAAGLDTDERADVYSIGAILYHLLSGRSPYGEQISWELVRQDPPVRIHCLVPQADPDLLAIVERAMQGDANDRYRSADELADHLARAHARAFVGVRRYRLWEVLFRAVMSNFRVVVPVLLVAFAMFAVVLVALWHMKKTSVDSLQERIRRHLSSLAAVATYAIDVNDVARVQGRNTFTDPQQHASLCRLVGTLKSVKSVDYHRPAPDSEADMQELKYAWIMRPTADPSMFEFVADDTLYDCPCDVDLNQDGQVGSADGCLPPCDPNVEARPMGPSCPLDADGNGRVDPHNEGPGLPGDSFDAGKYPSMRRGLEMPSADLYLDKPDRWGVAISGYAPIVIGDRSVALLGFDMHHKEIVLEFENLERSFNAGVFAAFLLTLSVIVGVTVRSVMLWRTTDRKRNA